MYDIVSNPSINKSPTYNLNKSIIILMVECDEKKKEIVKQKNWSTTV